MKNEFLSTYVANNLRACQLKQLSMKKKWTVFAKSTT